MAESDSRRVRKWTSDMGEANDGRSRHLWAGSSSFSGRLGLQLALGTVARFSFYTLHLSKSWVVISLFMRRLFRQGKYELSLECWT